MAWADLHLHNSVEQGGGVTENAGSRNPELRSGDTMHYSLGLA